MEIKLNVGDKITIPTGCKATIKENTIVIEEQKEVFKDGDVLISGNKDYVVIFKSYNSTNEEYFCSYCNNRGISDFNWVVSSFRHATEKEKQAFFDELKAKGLRWNAKTKTMERIRQRAKKGENYLMVGARGGLLEFTENDDDFDNKVFNSGNYYLLEEREQAEEDAKAVKAIFEKRKIENI